MPRSIGNQCSSYHTCEKCSCLGVRATILTATFWTCWSLSIVCFGSPYASRVAEVCLAYGCNMMFHRHQCIIQNTNVSSYRWFANHLYHHKPTEIDIRKGGTRWQAFSTTSSVLSLFILSMSTVCHPSIEISHTVFIANFARSAEDDSKVTYNCMSLAYKWKATFLVSHNITQGWRIKQEKNWSENTTLGNTIMKLTTGCGQTTVYFHNMVTIRQIIMIGTTEVRSQRCQNNTKDHAEESGDQLYRRLLK